MVSDDARSRLDPLRTELGEIDKQILELVSRRQALAQRIGQVKRDAGIPTRDYRQEKDGAERVENLEELVNAAQTFVREADLAVDAPIRRTTADEAPAAGDLAGAESEAASDAGAAVDEGATDPLTAFLAHAALEAGDTQAAEGRPALQLMTIHAAKGLEFHTVFVTGLEEGLFPHENSLDEMDGVEEERRLMYVAVTRARRRLYLSLAQSRMLHGQVRYGIASRFVDEVPAELVQWLSARVRRGAFAADRPSSGAGTWAQPNASVSGGPRATPAAPTGRIGQSVRHAKFGVGVIIDAEGRGSDARVQVNFRDAGVKWLALDYARLEAA